MNKYNIYLNGKLISTISFSLEKIYEEKKIREQKTREYLIDHEGYNKLIIVKEN